MKEKFRKGMFNYSVLFVLVLFTNTLTAQTNDVYSIEKTFSTKGVKSLKINSYDVNTRILPSSDKTIKVKLTFEAISNKEGEIYKLKSFLETTLIQPKGEELYVTNIGAKKSTFVNDISKEKAKLVFDDGRVKLTTLDWKLLEIYIPENTDLVLESYFSKVSLDFPFKGELEINAFESDIKAMAYEGNLTVADANFSKLYFGNLKIAKIKLNDSDFTAKSMKECVFDSKFSDIIVGQCNDIEYNGFEDKLLLTAASSAHIKSNFSEITIGNVDKMVGEIFEGSLKMDNCKDAVLIGKHTEVEVQHMGILKIRDWFECDLSVDTLSRLYCLKGEFNEFNIGYLEKTFSIVSTQTDVKLLGTAKDFEYINLDGKFVESEICISKHSSYRLSAEVQFSEIVLNKADYKVELYEKELSDQKFIYHFGTDSKNSNIRINGYEMDVEIIHGQKLTSKYNPMSNPDNYLNNWILIKKDGLYGFTDIKGKEVVHPQYTIIHPFDDFRVNWALVQKGEKYGFIDNKGQEIVEVKYDRIHQFDEVLNNWAVVELDSKYGVIDIKGKLIIEPTYDNIESLVSLGGQ